ncbi:MAG: FAD-dependent oxidoreductase, partial [Pseudomonadota bacterium]|nr:FAD-dependent oxidoreductase [Pseudomonadota bacterium]
SVIGSSWRQVEVSQLHLSQPIRWPPNHTRAGANFHHVQGRYRSLQYDRLVFALGSRLVRPEIPGLETHSFDVDTYEAAVRLNDHIGKLPSREPASGQFTILVVGGGLTGIEVAAEMFGKLQTAIARAPGSGQATGPRVILADRQPWIGSDMGETARPVIAEALRTLGVETRVGVSVASVDEQGATLTNGEHIEAATVVWCAGMQSSPLTARFPVERDRLGRLPVDPCLKIKGMAAGVRRRRCRLAADRRHSSVRHVVPARSPDGALCRLQRRV